jgi:hypothetical protein
MTTRFQISVSVVTLSFTHPSITLCNHQRLSDQNPAIDIWVCEAHVGQYFWEQSLQH